MEKIFQVIISANVAQSMYDLVADVNDPRKPEIWEDREIVDRLRAIQGTN